MVGVDSEKASTPTIISGASMLTDFQQLILSVCSAIPKGKVTTYSKLAAAAHTKGYQAVGMALNRNPTPITIPCHRVVAADGSISGYINGVEKKRELLKQEGIKFDSKGKVLPEHIIDPPAICMIAGCFQPAVGDTDLCQECGEHWDRVGSPEEFGYEPGDA